MGKRLKGFIIGQKITEFYSLYKKYSITWSTTTEWRLQRELDVFLRVQSNNERWDVHDLLTHSKKLKLTIIN